MSEQIDQIAARIAPRMIAYRRDFHRHAESGWTEFRTASLVARRLTELGYEVKVGREVVDKDTRMGVPANDALERCWLRAREQGGDPHFLEHVRGAYTGVVGILSQGSGPTIGLRFDMDAVDVQESQDPAHRPFREGFASVNAGVMHACGHDGHTAIGLGIAELLMQVREHVQGTVKLVFQPAEEGVRGAKAMVAAGVVDDVDFMLGHHLYSGWTRGEINPGKGGYLATSKFDADIVGSPAHAGGRPNDGNNALLAAATAVLNLQAIPRHQDGTTRINVGRLVAGTGRNVICPNAHMVIETRGASTGLNEFMHDYAVRILETSAAMHGCTVTITAMGGAQSANSSPELTERVETVAQAIGGFAVREPESSGGSEDYTYMMTRVQERGGLATNIGVGADLGGWGHHTAEFDIDERALQDAARLLASVTLDLMKNAHE